MAKSLEQYARENPTAEPEQEREQRERITKDYHERQQERQDIERIKEGILSQLEQGTAPQYILYPALQAIGILTHDEAWTKQGQAILDKVYEDLGQQSFLVDNEAVAAERLDQMQAEYNARLKKQIKTRLNEHKKIERALYEALDAIERIEQPDTTEP